MPDLQTHLDNLGQQGLIHNHRYWVWISGDKEWCHQQAEKFTHNSPAVSIGDNADYSIKQAKFLLGQESSNVIYDAFSGMDSDALAITAGIVKAGGLFILLSPPANDWPCFADPLQEKRKSWSQDKTHTQSYFIQRLCRSLEHDSQCFKVQQNSALAELPGITTPVITSIAANQDIFKTLDQEEAVVAIKHVLTGHRRRPLVITADRGRGKTSALGIAAAQLLKQGLKQIIVTAPQWQSVSALFSQLQTHLPEGQLNNQEFSWQQGKLSFLPIDSLIQDQPETDLLLVDEAAAIPAPLLEQLLHYSRVVFSTTVQGYEGSGRGFQIRFFRKLDQLTPNWRHIKLTSPIRWGNEDPLETSLYRALLFETPPHSNIPASYQTEILQVNGQQLSQDETLLQQLFGLLVQAHYKTTPSDLQALLDTVDAGCLIVKDNNTRQLLAATFYVYEGGFPEDLCQQIWLGKRRPKGHLLPQSLASHSGFPLAARLKGMRVIRIAVMPELQRHGLGKKLLQKLKEQANLHNMDFIGSSFGATEDVLSFWQDNSYQLFRLGLQLDASSGTHSALMWQPLSNKAKELNQQVQLQWQKQLPLLLSNQFNKLSPGLILKLFKDIQAKTLDDQDWLDVYSYGFGQRGFDNVTFSLGLFSQHCLTQAQEIQLSTAEIKTLCLVILQQQNWPAAAKQLGLTGKKELDKNIRQCFKRLLPLIAPMDVQARLNIT